MKAPLLKEIQENMLFEKLTNEYSNMVMFKRFYLEELRTKCRAMKFSDLFSRPEMFKDYLILKPRYQILKMLVKHPRLIEFFIKDLKTKEYEFSTK